MEIIKLKLDGAFLIKPTKFDDERGFFSRIFCVNELSEINLDTKISQINNSFSKKKRTLRGMHVQIPPNSETKIVRCIKGEVYDVIIDLRQSSTSFGKWEAVTLSENNRYSVYIPKGFGHGFMTLKDNTEMIYSSSEFYTPEKEVVINWADSFLSIDWPFTPNVLSLKDSSAPFIKNIGYFAEIIK